MTGLAGLAPMKGAFLSLTSADTWVLAAFLLFVGVLLYFGVPGTIGRMLDERAERIRAQIAEARSLREEAQRKLAEAERKLKEAGVKAQEIIAGARDEAAQIAEQARADMQRAVARRLQSAEDQIARAEADAVRRVRDTAVDAAVGAVRDALKSGDAMLDDAIDQVSRQLAG